jgi:hypothetical protein
VTLTTNNQPQPQIIIMKYALINTMPAFDQFVGALLSRHYTLGAAQRADADLQRCVKRYNGRNSYLPTIICQLDGGPRNRGAMIHDSWLMEAEQ